MLLFWVHIYLQILYLNLGLIPLSFCNIFLCLVNWVKVAQWCPTLCDPMDYTVHGILQARILEWVRFPFAGDPPNPGIEARSPTLQTDSLTAKPPWKPSVVTVLVLKSTLSKYCYPSLLVVLFHFHRMPFSFSSLSACMCLQIWFESLVDSTHISLGFSSIQQLCELNKALNSFSFNIIIDRCTYWSHVDCFLVVLSFFFVCVFFL